MENCRFLVLLGIPGVSLARAMRYRVNQRRTDLENMRPDLTRRCAGRRAARIDALADPFDSFTKSALPRDTARLGGRRSPALFSVTIRPK